MTIPDNLFPDTSKNKNSQEEFLSLLLASSIHEVKNNFGKLVFAINNALEELPDHKATHLQDRVNSEIRHISNQLSQILIIYKDFQSGYAPMIDEVQVNQLLRETRARHMSLSNLQIGTECEADLLAYMDDKFIVNVLDTLIYNSSHAGANQILISASQEQSAVKIVIEDNGPGFSDAVVTAFNSDEVINPEITQEKSSFGLGLFFTKKILALHRNEDHQGSCTIANGGRLNGAVVTLYFP